MSVISDSQRAESTHAGTDYRAELSQRTQHDSLVKKEPDGSQKGQTHTSKLGKKQENSLEKEKW